MQPKQKASAFWEDKSILWAPVFPLGGLGRDLKNLQSILQQLPPALMEF